MIVRNEADLRGILRIGQICGHALVHMFAHVEPGMTTYELDRIGEAFLKKHSATSAPIEAYNYPGWTCISLNEQAAHGIPGKRVIQPGDLLNIDVSAVLEGYWGDTGASMVVPPVQRSRQRLCDFTREALYAGIQQARAGNRVNQIGKACSTVAKRGGYRVIRELAGHGVGRSIHENPSVPAYYNRMQRDHLREGMVLTIEPFLNAGRAKIITDDDGWTLRTADRSLSAQYEHTVVITPDEPILVTKVEGGH